MKSFVQILMSIWGISHYISAYGYHETIPMDEGEILAQFDKFPKELEIILNDIPGGYGTEWIIFPDGDGIPHFVNLSMPNWIQSRSGGVKGVEYRLYVRGVSNYISLDQSAEPLDEANVQQLLSNRPIKVVTHGWMSSAEKSVIMGIKDSYLTSQDVAIIGVDWSETAMRYLYPIVADETWDVGSRVGLFLNSLSKMYDISGDRMHLIGHSLGAHVMGIAASNSNLTIGRITGLDPARPLFEFPKNSNSRSLDSSDADFVDVIHSCSGTLGVQNPIGHADFYPNSGAPPQPGCGSIFLFLEACSHGRSHIYFAESIRNPTGFPACRNENWTDYLKNEECKEQIYMGDNVDLNATGQYYLKTNANKPYARNN